MDIKKLVKDLDETILFADIVGAANRFFADNVKTISGDIVMVGKPDRIRTLERFMESVIALNQIQLHHQGVTNNDSYSLFTFDFTRDNGDNLVWYEIIRRRWEDGKVVEEEYFIQPTDAQIKQFFGAGPKARRASGTDDKKIEAFVASRQKRKPGPKPGSKRKVVTPVSERKKPGPKPGASKRAAAQGEVKERRKPGPKPKSGVAKAATTKVPGRKPGRPATKPKLPSSELRQIKDLGPKVDNLLNMAGIKTFSDLANAKKEVVMSILQSAGPRFKEFDPTPWMKEAAKLAKKK